jgi:hypothetical protein
MRLSSQSLAQSESIDEQDQSGNIKTATWVILGVTVAAFMVRQTMKAVVFRRIALDDLFIAVAVVRSPGNAREQLTHNF